MKLDLEAPPADASTTIAQRFDRLRADVASVAVSAGRDPASIAILAVTKFHPRDAVLEAYAAGARAFGENYVQEALPKYDGLPSDAVRSFIGHLQTNKAKAIAAGFDLVQSVDRPEAGLALAKAARALGKSLRVLIQLNISPSERFGIEPEAAPALAASMRGEGLIVDGVMAIGPATADRTALHAAFRRAADAHRQIGGAILSLGMSEDWREAVACGSTMIRIGTAIFGPRDPKGVSPT